MTVLSFLLVFVIGMCLGHLHGRCIERKALIGTSKNLIFHERLHERLH